MATQHNVQICAYKFSKTEFGEIAAAKNLMTTVGVNHKGKRSDVLWTSLNESAKACIINNDDKTRKVFNDLLSLNTIACKKQ